MAQANLSEILFKPKFKHPETSTLVLRARNKVSAAMHSALEGDTTGSWYRILNPLLWAWRGVSPIEIHEVLARIAASDAERSNPQRLDTVVGYRNGNWIYEWIHQGMQWQQRATEQQDPLLGGEYWLKAASLYSIAGYPHLKGDELAEQAEMLANRAYEEAALLLPYQLKELEFRIEGGGSVTGFLHMPE
ncbi:TPA: alpha/beta hydrolase, partial [Serratia marcescens]